MRIVFSAAVMDMLHEGHLHMLRMMRVSGDISLMVLHNDESVFRIKGKFPIESLEKRTMNLLRTGLVDIVRHTNETEPHRLFRELHRRYCVELGMSPVFLRGDDNPRFPARETIEELGIPIKLIPYTEGVSSSIERSRISCL